MSCQFNVSFVGEIFFFPEMCKLLGVVNFDCDVILLPIALEVGKLEIININLNKQFISLRKVLTEHQHRTPWENLKAKTTKNKHEFGCE